MTDFDLAPDFDFNAAMREAEEKALADEPDDTTAEVEPDAHVEPAIGDTAEVAVEGEQTDEVPRNADGTFAPRNPPAEPEADAATQLLAGRFKSQEELERGYLELLRMDGQKSNELGELRRAFEERMQAFEERASQPAPQRITAELIENNPAAAAQLAYEQRDEYALQTAFEYWKDEDPASAASWAAARHIEQREAAMRAEYEERMAQLEQRFQPLADANREQELVHHTREVLALHPDAQQFMANGMVGQIAQEFPDIAASLASNDPVRTASALRAAVEIAKGRVAGNLEQTSTDVQRQADEQAALAREGAFVASATQTSTPPVKTVEEQEADRFTERVQSRATMWDGGWDRG